MERVGKSRLQVLVIKKIAKNVSVNEEEEKEGKLRYFSSL